MNADGKFLESLYALRIRGQQFRLADHLERILEPLLVESGTRILAELVLASQNALNAGPKVQR